MKLTNDIVVIGVGCSPEIAAKWTSALQAACDKYNITSPMRAAAFLANVGVESAGLTAFEENLNYSAQGLANTWPTRYSQNPQANPRVPNEQAMGLAHNPQAIANNVYADRMGNGHELTGDGWRYRGVGPIQLSGHDNIIACCMDIDVDFTEDFHSALKLPEKGSMSAAWFFGKRAACNDAAEAGNFNKVVQLINGQPPVASNHGPLRVQRYQACLQAFSDAAASAPPAPVAPPATTAKKLPAAK